MVYEEKVVTKYEMDRFLKGEQDTKVHEIWNNMIATFPEALKKEASEKGFKLNEVDRAMGLTTYMIELISPSDDLRKEVESQIPFIICNNE